MSSVAVNLRSFLLGIDGFPFDQISQDFIPEGVDPQDGYIYYGRRATDHARTFDKDGEPDSVFFDIEIYHSDPGEVEAAADKIQSEDCYHGNFGDGFVSGFFAETQTDDYMPRVQFTDEVAFHAAFLSVEIRNHQQRN